MDSRSRDRDRDIRDAVVTHLPDYRVDSVVLAGEGQDNIAYEVNGELMVRFSKECDPARRAARVDHEARLLAAVAAISPLPVPQPTFTVAEQGCLAYFKIPGRPLLDLPQSQRQAHGRSIAATLGELLTAMHAAPIDRMAGLVDTEELPLDEWQVEAAQNYATVAAVVPVKHQRPIEAFLDAAAPDDGYALVFSHNDLGIEHVLVDPATWNVTGIIDWSDAAIVDPAHDFGLLYRDLGPAIAAAIGSYRSDVNDVVAVGERATFYARCSVFEDLAHGMVTGQDRYVDKSLAALEWLFPPGR
jgi:aminoglycoside phosphotransferase (APT) family kinase protein